MNDLAQPNASHLPAELLETLVKSVAGRDAWKPQEIVYCDSHCNDFAEVRLNGGRSLVVKRGRYDWAIPRFATSRLASTLIRESTGLTVPAPLPLPLTLGERPLEAYWRIDLPTLQELWPTLTSFQRNAALRSWGELTAQLHSVHRQGFGPLVEEHSGGKSLEMFLRAELEGRLMPAMSVEWPEAVTIAGRLLPWVTEVDSRVAGRSRLVHNDLHMGNVLCEFDGETPRCVGLLDLETAVAAPPEADIAGIEVHHGAHFSQPLPAGWEPHMRSGYTEPLDDLVVNFYRAFHFLNMGFYSAIVGHHIHASEVASAADAEVSRLEAAARSAGAAESARLNQGVALQ